MNKAFINDSLLLIYNRPIQFIVVRLTSLFGKSTYIPKQGYFVNDLKLAKTILKDQENFTSSKHGALGDLAELMAGKIPLLVNMHGKEHLVLRQKLMSVFNKSYVENVSNLVLTPYLKKIVKDLEDGEEVDIAELIKIVTNKMTAYMLGIDYIQKSDEQILFKISELTDNITQFLTLGKIRPSDKELEVVKGYYDQLTKILDEHFDNIKDNDSIISKLKKQDVPKEVTLGLLVILMVAGTETVASGLPRGIALLHDSNQFEILFDSDENIESAIHEILRFTSPSPLILHGVNKDCEFEGIKFKAGRRLLVCQYNILHKSQYNKNANNFDIKRVQSKDTQYFWFGHGAHYCLGAALAMEEIRVILRELSLPKININITSKKFKKNSAFPTFKELKIKYETSQ